MATARPKAREYVLQRDYILSTTLGHRIAFEKGKPVSVPSEIEHMAVGIGAQPVEGEIEVTLEDQNPAINTGPNDPKERGDEIKTAMKMLVEANQRHDFAASGAPKVNALERVLGYPVDARERDKYWQALHDEAAGTV